MKTTVGQILINEALPPEMQDYNRHWDGDVTKEVMRRLQTDYDPETYKKVAQALMQVGGDVSHSEGSSFSLRDLLSPKIKKQIIPMLQARIQAIADDDSLTQQQKDETIVKEVGMVMPKMSKAVQAEGELDGNKLAEYVKAKARGNASQVNQMRGSTLQVMDHKGRPIPVPIMNSFADGLDPVELWATSYGVRHGFSQVKAATPKAGFFSKQLVNAVHRLVVSDADPMEGTGLPVDTNDADNEGAALARDTGPFKAGTILTPRHLKILGRQHKRILVHSPIASVSKGIGIPAIAAGMREYGRLATAGENVGISAAQAMSEPLAQGAISCLAEGTMVRMADLTVKPIEDIQVGDKVLGSDTEGRITPVTVTRTYDQGVQPCWEFVFRRGCARVKNHAAFESLVSTSEHKVLGRRRHYGAYGTRDERCILKVGEIDAGLGIYASSPAVGSEYMPIAGKEKVGNRRVYDIEVDHPDHLFLLENGMIVSNSKHVAGVAGASVRGSSAEGAKGFEAVNNLANIPKEFPDGATLAKRDGVVSLIQDAPQGGKFVYIGEDKHYVPPQIPLSVEVGSKMEAGDVLSDGIPNPSEVVQYKGLGEGRRYFMQQMYKTIKNSGVPIHRRNVELVARGIINHVRITDPDGLDGHMVDDIVGYDDLASRYKPRDGAEELPLSKANNRYLERPTLHYSIGTRVTPKMAAELKEFGVKNIMTHKDPPPFEPEMIRAMDGISKDEDWMTRLGGFNLEKNFLQGVHSGAGSKVHGTSYLPSLAQGVGFGTGSKPGEY